MRGGQHWRSLGLWVALMVPLALDGCAGRPPAPIEDRNATPATMGRLYRVQPGDTLYSIAWRYGLDYSRLAAANAIPAPFTIYAGQQIELREGDRPTTGPSETSPSETDSGAASSSPNPVPTASSSGSASATPVAEKRATPTPPSTTPPRRPREPGSEAAIRTWRWPAEGAIVRGFSSTLHKGIAIGGAQGDPVLAAAPGQVVYAGTGIPGYGELLIIRHNARYLSAYGHNDRLLVSEGDRVRGGQKIATRGSSGTNAIKLHFEIRENGKPIDPMKMLPRR